MEKYISAALYFVMLSVFLIGLTRWYSYHVLMKNNVLDNPFWFAVFTLLIGFVVSAVYYLFNLILKIVLTAISKRETNAFYALSSHERTMIGIAACLMVGFVVHDWSREHPEFATVHYMLFSLPVAKLGFITTSCKELWTDIRKLVMKSISVWPFLLYIVFETAIYTYLEEYMLIINLSLMLGMIIFLAVSAYRQGENSNAQKTACDK